MKALHLLAPMTIARPILSRRFPAGFAASAMDKSDGEHIGTYVDNNLGEAPRTVDSVVGECPKATPTGVVTFRTEPDSDPNPLPALTPASAIIPRKRGRPKHGPVEHADSRRKKLKAAWLDDATALTKKRAQLAREGAFWDPPSVVARLKARLERWQQRIDSRNAAWQEAEDEYDKARLAAAREEGYAAGFAAGVQSVQQCERA